MAGDQAGDLKSASIRKVPNDGTFIARLQADSVRIVMFHLWKLGHLNRPQFAGGSKVSMDGAYGKK